MATNTTMATAGAIGSAATSIGSAWATSSSYKVQKMQAETAAYVARVQGEADVLQLQQQYNQGMASNAVMAAAQGRRGGSVSAMSSAAEAQFNWDADFTKLSTQMRESGYQSQIAQLNTASKTAMIGGSLGAISKGAQSYSESLYSIGKSTQNNPEED